MIIERKPKYTLLFGLAATIALTGFSSAYALTGVDELKDVDDNHWAAPATQNLVSKGIISDGFLYRRGLYVAENATFALRSVAYSGKYYRAVKNLTYNEFDYDKRKDVIIVFRIVERDEAGNVTILWKQLQEKDAPEVKRVPLPEKNAEP